MRSGSILFLLVALAACGGKQAQRTKPGAAPGGQGQPQPVASPAPAAPPASPEAGAPNPAPEPDPGVQTSGRLAKVFFNFLRGDNFASASAMFHVPSTYNQKERAEDLRVIEKWLRLVTAGLGQISNPRPPSPKASIVAEGIGGGDETYWQNKKAPVNLTLEVDFATAGVGYVIFGVMQGADGLELRTVSYGLPSKRPEARKFLAQITAPAK